jgi:hypothetical protein
MRRQYRASNLWEQQPSQVWKPQNTMDTNRSMVYSGMEMGVGREAMSVMCDIFSMPPPPPPALPS